jgi:hypothetical protein
LHGIEELSSPPKPYRKTNEKRLKQKNRRKWGVLITTYAFSKKMEAISNDQG